MIQLALTAREANNINKLIGLLETQVTDADYDHSLLCDIPPFGATLETIKNQTQPVCALGHANRNPLLFDSFENSLVIIGDGIFGRGLYTHAFSIHAYKDKDGRTLEAENVTRTMAIERLKEILMNHTKKDIMGLDGVIVDDIPQGLYQAYARVSL